MCLHNSLWSSSGRDQDELAEPSSSTPLDTDTYFAHPELGDIKEESALGSKSRLGIEVNSSFDL